MSSKERPNSILKRQKNYSPSPSDKPKAKRPRSENIKTAVSFNPANETRVYDSKQTSTAKNSEHSKRIAKDEDDYDSDDFYDTVASSGGENFHLNISNRGQTNLDSSAKDDAFSKTKLELLAKRKKKNQIDALDDEDSNNFPPVKKRIDYFRGEEVPSSQFSLLHEKNAHNSLDYDENGNLKDRSNLNNDKNTIPIEPFNMKNEREGGGGYFEGDTYVFRKSRGDQEIDEWVDSLENENLHKPKLNNTSVRNKDDKNEEFNKEEILLKLHELLSHDEETVQLAIQRCGRDKKSLKKRLKKNPDEKLIALMNLAESSLNDLIEHANTLLMMDDGNTDIYEYSKHRIASILSLQRTSLSLGKNEEDSRENALIKPNSYFQDLENLPETITEKTNKPLPADIWEWEYRGNEDDEIHGPYSTEQMLSWIQAGYFVNENAVDVRKKKRIQVTEIKENERVDDLMDDLLDDEEEQEDEWIKSDKIDFSALFLGTRET